MRTILYRKDLKAADFTSPIPVTNSFDTTDAFNATASSPNATTAHTIKAATASKSIYVTDVVISTSTAMNVTLQDEDGNIILNAIYLAANGTFEHTFATPKQVTSEKALNFKASASGTVTVSVDGYVV